MKKILRGKYIQKATAILLTAVMVLSVFAVLPADLFKASAASNVSFDDRLELDFNNDWKFHLGHDTGAHLKTYNDSAWIDVELPHDFSISQDFTRVGTEDESGQLPGGTGWYRKTFIMPSEARDKSVILNFDGSYKDTYVYVNGKLIGENHYGYNSFSFDITDYLVYDGKTANIIAVKVENQLPSSRWYSGSGIYRDVTMTIVDPVHVALYGTQVTTPNIESSNGNDGTVHATITLNNDNSYDQTVSVATQILDATGTPVGTASQAEVTARHGAQTTATLTPTLANPNLWNSWDLGTPYLYTLRTTVSENGKVIDTYDTEFGYRWFNWDADGGFSLNGHNLKIEGVCMHHDQGVLGAAQEYDAIYRQVMILKDMGCNSIRTSHGTPSDVFMDICNELGMLVMNEFFDGWNAPKNGNTNDFSVYFDQEIDITTNNILNAEADQMWYEFVTVQTVKRDRNDPSIVIWDVGNELTEGATGVVASEFNVIAQNMQTIIDQLDPTRPICQGNNGPTDSIRTAVDGFMDVIGGNYNMSTWSNIMTGTSDSRSTKPYVGTETASALSTRGHYSNAYYNSVLTMINAANSDYAINAYDTGKVSWGEVAAAAWYNTIIYDWNSGEYVWTGFDYIGEPTPWNTTGTPNDDPNSSYFGIIDTAGFAKDTYYLYRSMWNEHSTTLHLIPGTWDSSALYVDGSGYVDVAVYSNADKIELFGNGSLIASATATTTTTDAGHSYQTWAETTNSSNVATTEFYTGNGKDFYSQFHVNHSAYSELSVKAYEKLADGSYQEITETVGTNRISDVNATKINAELWSDVKYTADGDSFIYVEYTAQDANGNFDSTYNGTINVTLHGDEAILVGVDNGDQATTQKFQQSSVFVGEDTVQVQMFNGKALVALRTNENTDNDVTVTATADDGISVASVSFATTAETGDELTDEFEEIVPQPENLVYEPTLYDEYEALKTLIVGDGSNSLEANYTYYPANPDGTKVVNMDIPNGWYIIKDADGQGGVMTHTTHSSNGLTSDGTTGVPAASADAWYFEKTNGGYNIYYEDNNGVKQYLTISNNQVYVSTTPYALAVTTDASGDITIGFGSSYLSFTSGSDRVWNDSTPTTLNLYYVDTTGGSDTTTTTEYVVEGQVTDSSELASLDNGWYILKGAGWGNVSTGAITHTAHSSGGLQTDSTSATATPTTTDNVMWYFEKQSDGTYYVYYLNDSGTKQYMTLTSSTVVISTTPQALTVTASGTQIKIGASNGYYVDFCGNSNHSQHVATWTSGTSLYVYKVTETTVTTNPTTTTITEVTNASSLDGEYIITGQDDYTGTYAYGALTHATTSGGLIPANSSDITADEENLWIFEPTTGGYYIYFVDANGVKQYMAIDSSGISLTTTPTVLAVTDSDGNGTVIIGATTNNYKANYFGSAQKVGVWTSGTELTLYEVETVTTSADGVTMWLPTASDEIAPPVENGEYVIYDSNYIMSGETSSVGLGQVAETPSNNVITTFKTNAYTFTLVDGTTNQYYIKNSEGKYLTIGSTNGSVALSDTATSLYVYGTTDNNVVIYSGSQALDHYVNEGGFNTWSSTYTSASENQKMTLYKNENPSITDNIPAEKQELYNALVEGIQHAPGTYSASSYQTLFDALTAGYDVLEDENATEAEITNATVAINTAIAGLGIEYKYFPSTIYKYGYNPANTSAPYDIGGATFNAQTYASMEAKILADDNLMTQIKAAIGYDTETWASDEEKATALDAMVDAYARIYSLSFTGAPVTGVQGSADFYRTAWNVWCKSNTQGANESTEEGASVQGLFSALSVDGVPVDHAIYDVFDADGNAIGLPYGNAIDNSNRESYNTINGISVSITRNGASANITLPNLQGISVHINDMFKKENVYANNTDASEGYSKFYWDMQFPFITTTNEYGINTYVYSSSSDEYLFQADYDDATQTATAQLSPIEDWSVNRDTKDAGTGFFPFNYQQGATSYTGENAIYHYSMTFGTDFYIPVTGTYADGEDVIFSFSGDDDVLVYIDDVLVLDNGGLHGARSASINFTDASISYQYAMDVTESTVESTTENAVTYTYGASNADVNADELAALRKLNEVRTDGEYHTFTFYYVERGSTDSNCEIKFNLQQASEHVLLQDQTLVLDYGLPVEYYYVQSNDTITEEGKAAEIEYLGVLDANNEVDSVVTFSDPENLTKTFDEVGDTIHVDGLKFGTALMTKDGNITYSLNTLQMTGRDYFYFCASIYNDPTYAEGTTYYQYERINFIPATTIYYEDNYEFGLSFVDGTNATDNDNGKWEVVTDGGDFTGAEQADDLAGAVDANAYGYDSVYDNCSIFSGHSAHKVTVDANNNTAKGGTNPTFEFTFKGTGFDVISVTDNTTGVFYVEIFDTNGDRVGKRRVVDTYYGYSYGQLYADENGEATLNVTDIPLYKSEKDVLTQNVKYYTVDGTSVSNEVTYYDVSGVGYTETPTYYDADGNITETETENPAYAYAYAYGWLEGGDSTSLYQIPVIKINGLEYDEYKVVVTPMYTSMFDHTGEGKFDLYVDAIRIYHPAEKDAEDFIHHAYRDDGELHPNYLEIKDIVIGADSLSKDAQQGVIFIDGIAALDNDLEKYKIAGPNNELYLASEQAVAFEIWASAVPDEVQIGVKSVKGTPTFKATYGDKYGEKVIGTATEMNYVLNSVLPLDGKLTWSRVTVDGVVYYKTETIVLQNSAENDSILSLTSMKWTFNSDGQYGHYEVQNVELISTDETVSTAYAMMRLRNPVVDEGDDVVPETPVEPEKPDTPVTPETPVDPDVNDDVATDNDDVADENTNNGLSSEDTTDKVIVNEPITLTVTTSINVTELIIRDEKGNEITPDKLEYAIKEIDGKEIKVWTITLIETESGTYTYSVFGEFADGTVEEQEEIIITVTNPDDDGFFAKLMSYFADIVEFLKNLIAKIGTI